MVSWQEQDIFLFSKAFILALETNQGPVQWLPGSFILWGKVASA